MATFLDIGALQHFQGLFPFLLVLVLAYAIFSKTVFKDKPGVSALLAFILAILTLTSGIAQKTINLMAPWFVIFLIFGILILIAFMSFGIEEKSIKDVLTGSKYGRQFFWWVLGIMIIIGFGSLFAVVNEEIDITQLHALGTNTTSAGTGGAEAGFWGSLFDPKVLGMVVVLLVAYFTVSQLTEPAR
ncbi:hypothetical protein KY329_00950 [Candidatus Woesearchaeota archaeon]|nr:hypothetical protein [Candidatus Woesearchaeota archaeon]